jgi:hypothetical protein
MRMKETGREGKVGVGYGRRFRGLIGVGVFGGMGMRVKMRGGEGLL